MRGSRITPVGARYTLNWRLEGRDVTIEMRIDTVRDGFKEGQVCCVCTEDGFDVDVYSINVVGLSAGSGLVMILEDKFAQRVIVFIKRTLRNREPICTDCFHTIRKKIFPAKRQRKKV